MPRAPFAATTPSQVQARLRAVGAAIRAARQRRRWPLARLAAKAGIAIKTLAKAEAGDPGTSLGTWVTILWALNLDGLLTGITDPANDPEGLLLEAARRGERMRGPRVLDDDF